MKILAIETSCDETAAAVVEDGVKILTNVISSSAKFYKKYGGVVPEIAARKQVEYIIPVLDATMQDFTKDDIDAIAVTIGPGLIGSLLIGVETAKTLAWVWNKPLIPVNHVLAHMYAIFIRGQKTENRKQYPDDRKTDKKTTHLSSVVSDISPQSSVFSHPKFPAISLVVSGGHTELYLMESPNKLKWLGGTLDDAAGECFDKCARLLGFGNRGGLAIQEAAQEYVSCHPERSEGSHKHASGRTDWCIPSLDFSGRTPRNDKIVKLPRPMLNDKSLNFSFSGLKTAVARKWQKLQPDRIRHSGLSRIRILESSPTAPSQNDNLLLTQLFAHEIQEAITDVLVTKTLRTAAQFKAKSILLSGGVAANLRLREKFNLQLTTHNQKLFVPPVSLCTDNAVYIGCYAYFRGVPVDWKKIDAQPDLTVEVSQ